MSESLKEQIACISSPAPAVNGRRGRGGVFCFDPSWRGVQPSLVQDHGLGQMVHTPLFAPSFATPQRQKAFRLVQVEFKVRPGMYPAMLFRRAQTWNVPGRPRPER